MVTDAKKNKQKKQTKKTQNTSMLAQERRKTRKSNSKRTITMRRGGGERRKRIMDSESLQFHRKQSPDFIGIFFLFTLNPSLSPLKKKEGKKKMEYLVVSV